MYTRKQFTDQIRSAVMMAPSGNKKLVSDPEIEKICPKPMIYDWIEEGIVAVNEDLSVHANVVDSACVADTDVKYAPEDVGAIKSIEMFPGTTQALEQGYTMTRVGSVDELYNGEINPLTGRPERYMLWENQGELYFKWDRVPAEAYFFKIKYYPIPAKMTTDEQITPFQRYYDPLVRNHVLRQIALQVGDDAAYMKYDSRFEKDFAKASGVKSRNWGSGQIAWKGMQIL